MLFNKNGLCRAAATTGLVVLQACATQPAHGPDGPGLLAGFFHGLTALIALAVSLVRPVRVYAFPNGGFLYDLGFCTGFAASMVILMLLVMARVGGWLTRER